MIEIIGPALSQWDTGRSVKVTDIEAGYVHFANKGDAKAVIMELVDSQAKIPDYLFQTGKQLCVYAVKDGVTVESKVFYIQTRERPENYVYDDDQRNYIYELISKAETAIEGAYSAYENANHAVEAANTAIVSANVAVENANESANSAKQAAKNANESADSAKQAAKNANDAADKANHAAKDAVKTVNGIGPDENGNVVVEGGKVDLTGYATEEWVREGYQPKGEYLTEHQDISGKLDASALPTAINTALAQAKASGEFKGEPGQPGEPGKDYTLTEADKQEIAEQAAGLVEVPGGGGFVASDTPPADTSLLWVDTSDNSGETGGTGGGGDENIIPTETVLAEGVVATGASSWVPNDTGVSIATLNQYKRIRLAIKGASNKVVFWSFQFTNQNTKEANRIANASGMAVVLQKISNGYFRVEAIESRGNADTTLKGMVAKSDSWLSVRYGSISPVILDLTSYAENATLKIAPVSNTEIDYSWCVCGYNC